jgi:hypothetical protein
VELLLLEHLLQQQELALQLHPFELVLGYGELKQSIDHLLLLQSREVRFNHQIDEFLILRISMVFVFLMKINEKVEA